VDLSLLHIAVDGLVSTGIVKAASGSSDDASWVPLLFLLTGPAFFMFQYRRYRNTDKRHLHETETLSEVANMQGYDQPVQSVTGARESRMQGANEHEVRG
jgi:hypothetical protein